MSPRIFFAASILAVASAVSAADELRLSPKSFGPVEFGMSVEEASRLLGTALVRRPGNHQGDRYAVIPDKLHIGVVFTVAGGRIDGAYFDHSARYLRTDKNVGLGSSLTDVWRRYGAEVEAKTYKCGEDVLVFTYHDKSDPAYGLVYIVSPEGLVRAITAGRLKNQPPC
jgi:hypothetical protein